MHSSVIAGFIQVESCVGRLLLMLDGSNPRRDYRLRGWSMQPALFPGRL